MKKTLFILLGLPFILLLATPAMATGIGGYFIYSNGESIWNNDASGNRSTNKSIGGGLIIDSAVATDNLFNNRLNIGLENYQVKRRGYTEDLRRFSLFNTFGFGAVRTEIVRFWLGPQIGIRYFNGKNHHYIIDAESLVSITSLRHRIKYDMFGAYLGLTMGLNFNFGEVMTLALEGGFRYGIDGGTIISKSYSRRTVRWTYDYGYEGYASAAILFRINDTFGSK